MAHAPRFIDRWCPHVCKLHQAIYIIYASSKLLMLGFIASVRLFFAMVCSKSSTFHRLNYTLVLLLRVDDFVLVWIISELYLVLLVFFPRNLKLKILVLYTICGTRSAPIPTGFHLSQTKLWIFPNALIWLIASRALLQLPSTYFWCRCLLGSQ